MDGLLLYESLENAGLIKKGQVDETAVAAADLSDLIDVARMTSEVTSAGEAQRDPSAYAHTASLSLAGHASVCSNVDCRIDRTLSLARFAALYSDRVYVKNLLHDHVEHAEEAFKADANRVKERIKDDLKVLAALRPLVEAGRVIPLSPPENACGHCLAKLSFGADADDRLEQIMNELADRFLSEVEVTITWKRDRYVLTFEGPETLYEHGGRLRTFWDWPTGLQLSREVRRRVHAGKPFTLSPSHLEDAGYNLQDAGDVYQNIVFDLAAAQSLGTAFLTDQQIHVEVLNKLTGNTAIERRNQFAREYLTALVPFASELSIEDLLKIREQEGESFILFRQRLNEAFKELEREGEKLNERAARAIYSELVEPELARLDLTVKSAKRSFVKDARRRVAAVAGALTIGTFAGYIPSGIAAAAKALGLSKIVNDFLQKAQENSDHVESIRSESMYYLWRVREESRRK